MKVIDLLNKIANGKAPKYIKYNDNNYYLYNNCSYLRMDKSRFFDSVFFNELNDEVEIIEEKEEKEVPKKIPYQFSLDYIYCNINETAKEEINKAINDMYDKINEIIDYLIK